MNLWLKDTSGTKSATLTFAAAGFVFAAAKFILSGVTIHLLHRDINFGMVDAASIAAILTPTLGAYCARKHTDTKYGAPDADDTAAPKE